MSKVTEEVETIIIPILDDLNFELVDVKCAKKGKDHFLGISIGKGGDANLDDCTLVSEEISGAMNQSDPIPKMYYLDIASLGTECPLEKEKDYQNTIGQPVFVSLCTPIEGDKEWSGILKSVDDDTIAMEVRERSKKKIIEIPRNRIAGARHAVMI